MTRAVAKHCAIMLPRIQELVQVMLQQGTGPDGAYLLG
jgi:hypothetical protein